MDIHFEPITEKNRAKALTLHTAPGQEGFVESVAQCLSEADRRKSWRPVAICDKDTMVGFAMYGYFWEYLPFGRVWLDRLLIDAQFQGRGYATAALALLIDRLKGEYNCRKIYLSVIDGNATAVKLYRRFGFEFNGKKDIHGEKIMVKHL